jgi:hypothetical protein
MTQSRSCRRTISLASIRRTSSTKINWDGNMASPSRMGFDVKCDSLVVRWLLDLVERQLGPIIDLPGIELHQQTAKNRHV